MIVITDRRILDQQLQDAIYQMRTSGVQQLNPPWPGPSQPLTGLYFWSNYSPEDMLKRAVAVHEAALVGYRQLVDQWFSGFSSRMETAAVLPARIVGELDPKYPVAGGQTWPILNWYFEPLPLGEDSVVDFRLHHHPLIRERGDVVYERLIALRPEAAEWLSFSYHSGLMEIFDAKPATKIVYDWLAKDLERVGWM